MEKKFTSNRISYLHNLCNVLSSAPHSNLLKSFYLSKTRLLQPQSDKILPAALTKKSACCPRCCLPHNETNPSYRIEPERLSRFARKMLKKCDHDKRLTTYQRKSISKLKDCKGNKLVINCGLCKKKIKIPLTKTIREIESLTETPVIKKKRKRKDRYSGLDASVVLSATPQKMVTPRPPQISQRTPISLQNNSNGSELSSTLKKKPKNKSTLSKILNESKHNPKKSTTKLKDFLCSLSF